MLLNKKEASFFIELGINKALADSLENFEESLRVPDRKFPVKKRGGVKR
jgi:hypothetical protein